MAIVNRDLDVSQQSYGMNAVYGTVNTGVTLAVGIVQSAGQITDLGCAVFGASGSPSYAFHIQRFIVGTGITVITGGATTLTMANNGTSGITEFPLISASSTLMAVLPYDLLCVTSGAANTAVTGLALSVVIKNTQDIVTKFGT